MPRRNIIAIGASGGGLEALKILVSDLDPGLRAAIFVVMHIAPHSKTYLHSILSKSGPLPASLAADGECFQRGHIYVASPDHHLLVGGRELRVTKGPRENRARPAVDPLLRTAAAVHGPRVIGVVLTGSLDDGTSGLLAVKAAGGIAVVQDPEDAAYSGMPESALQYVDVDHVVPIHRMGGLLNELVGTSVPENEQGVDDELEEEAEMERDGRSDIEHVERLGSPASLGCPECGGPLWEMSDEPISRFRCHTGHTFSSQSLIAEMSETTERSLWVALRTMEERTRMLDRLASEQSDRGNPLVADEYRNQASESRTHSEAIRALLSP